MQVSHSKIDCFKSCHRKHFYKYEMLLTPKVKSWNLIDGDYLHQALEVFYTTDKPTTFLSPDGQPPSLVKKCIEWGVDDSFIPVLWTVDNLYDAMEVNESSVEFHRHLVMGMVAGYCIRYSPTEFKSVQPEKEVVIDVDDFKLKVKIDALVEKTDGVWWIHERKSTSAWKKEKFLERILMDYQPTCYAYVMNKLGYDILGTLYDVIRKPYIKKWALETPEQFNERMVRLLIADALKPKSQYYYREDIRRSKADLLEFEDSLKKTVEDMRNHKDKKFWYKNPARCFDFNTECDYLPLCKEADLTYMKSLIGELYNEGGGKDEKDTNKN